MSPTYRAASTQAGGAGTTVTLTVPTGTQYNDLMLAGIYTDNATIGTVPTGYTQMLQIAATGFWLTLYWKRAAIESGSHVWVSASATFVAGFLAGYSRVHKTDTLPYNAVGAGDIGTSASATASSITPTVNNSTLVYITTNANGSAYTPPGGMTERFDFNMMLSDSIVQAVSTGSVTATLTSAAWAAVLIALTPAVEPFKEYSRRPAPFKPGLAR